MKAKSTRNTVQPVRFFQLAFLWVLILLLAGSSGAAWAKPTSGETAPGDILPEILSDGQFVDGPNVGAFELETFLNAQPGILKAPEYRNVIQDQADYFGINPKVLLTVIEMQSGLVTNPSPTPQAIANPIGYGDTPGFVAQMQRVAGRLSESFYWYLYDYQPKRTGSSPSIPLTLRDGTAVQVAGQSNAGTYAMQSVLAEDLDAQRWAKAVSLESPDGFSRTYRRLFPDDDPLDSSNIVGVNSTPPSNLLKLPYSCNDTWKFLQGPHDVGGNCGPPNYSDAPRSSLDFGPGTSCSGTPPEDRWITAAAAGTVLGVSCNGCLVKIDHGNGWQTHYFHVVNAQVSSGQSVSKNARIGNPSCRPSYGADCGSCGGFASGSHHVHFSILQNGAYQPIDGTSLEGWTVHETGCYAGYLTKGDVTVNEGGTVTSEVCGGCCGCGSLATSSKSASDFLLAQLPVFAPTSLASSVASTGRPDGSLAMSDGPTVRSGRSPSEEVQPIGRAIPTPQPIVLPDTVAPSPPADLRSDMHGTTVWSREPVVRVRWTAGYDAEGPLAGYAIAWDQNPDTKPFAVAALSAEAVEATSPPLSTGRWYAHLTAVDHVGNASATVHAGPFLVDVTAPTWPEVFASNSEPSWQNNAAPLRFTWPAAIDDDAGLTGYRVYWGDDPMGTAETSVSEPVYAPPALDGTTGVAVRYLRVVPVDGAGNRGDWRTVAVWRYDATPPTVALRINNGGETARVLPVTLHLAAEDTGSGVAAVRFSPDGASWTAWAPYVVQQGWTLADRPERQTVYAQVRDVAGNLSTVAQASVAVVLDSPRPSSASYQLSRSVFGMGGGLKTSASYRLQGTSGQTTGVGHLQGSGYQVYSGFWTLAATPTPTPTPTPTDTPIFTPTPTDTPIFTPTPTDTPIFTPTPTDTPIFTPTPTDTPILTPTPTDTPILTPTPTDTPVGPILRIATRIPAHTGNPVAVPVVFNRNGANIASTIFSVDFDQTCLAFDPTDGNDDGIPDAVVFSLPAAFGRSVMYDGNDSDGELDFFIADILPPLSALPDSTFVTITLMATCLPAPGAITLAPVRFSADPAASFGNTAGQSVPGTTYDGSVEIQGGTPGDCNADQRVDAGDISALVLEIFDGDGSTPTNTPGGTFPGDPVGCNANQDAVVDAGDISCTVLIIFNGPNACAAQANRAASWESVTPSGAVRTVGSPGLTLPDRAPAAPNSTVTLPLTFTAGGNQISSLIFSLDYDQAWLSFDPTDSDDDGIPDAMTLNLPDGFDGSVMFNAGDTDGELDFFIADTFPPLAWLPDGTLASVTLHTGNPPASTEATVNFSADPAASFGNTAGQSVPGIADNGSVWIALPPPTPVATATAMVEPTAATTITLPNTWGEVSLPTGLVTTTTVFTYSQIVTPTQNTGSFAFAGRSFTLEATDANGAPVTTFNGRFTITLNYQDGDWQAAGIPDENNLNLYYWDGAAWVAVLPCAGCSLDTVNNRITAVLDHLTEFALLGNPLAAPEVSGRKAGNEVELRWTQTQAGIVRYEVYRSTRPYFIPGDAGVDLVDGDVSPPGMGNEAVVTDAAPFSAPATNYYYLVVAVGAEEVKSPASNRVGAFHFTFVPGAQ